MSHHISSFSPCHVYDMTVILDNMIYFSHLHLMQWWCIKSKALKTINNLRILRWNLLWNVEVIFILLNLFRIDKLTNISPKWHETKRQYAQYNNNPMETFSALLSLCVGNPLVTGGFPSYSDNNADLWCFFVVSLKKNFWANTELTGNSRHHCSH